MRTTSNPILRTLPGKEGGGYAQFGAGAAGAGAMAAQQMRQDPYTAYPEAQAGVSRPLTIDDVVTKTGITLGVIVAVAIASFFLVSANTALALPFLLVGGLGGLVMVMIASFGRKQDNPAIVLSYAAFEGLFVGAISFAIAVPVAGANAGALIGQAVLGTVGVFIGMLFVYRSGAIRVTPKFQRMLLAGLVGVLVLALGNIVLGFFGIDMGLRSGGPIAIIFSLVCIGLAAFSFLIDFDAADQMVRAGAPEKAAWGIALGLAVTLVWLYVEILRLLSYFQND
ncbi:MULTISPECIES: Bax inhibitor-1/YccA family protein [unclassified Mycobacterium]|uniref:Bax inhibitor-1/YccA family protein n=1 Tax=unclassified Mycobacterium TaxID=2642494 RepID=UPI0009920A88|nr:MULTISPECIES: Bax inhibitor-1/YccA family protein [unclassified Mycobacterium]